MRQGRLPGCDAGIEAQPVAGYMPAESAMGRCDGPLRVHAWRKRQSGYPAWRSCISRKRETARASHPAGRHGWRAFREEEKITKRMNVSQERCFTRRWRSEKDGYSAGGMTRCKKRAGLALAKPLCAKKGRTLSGIKYSCEGRGRRKGGRIFRRQDDALQKARGLSVQPVLRERAECYLGMKYCMQGRGRGSRIPVRWDAARGKEKRGCTRIARAPAR